MNIFKILSNGDGSINEPNVSAFLAYLLDPNEDHGISSLFLEEVIKLARLQNSNWFIDLQSGKCVVDMSRYSQYTVNIVPELSVILDSKNKKKRRDIDILIEIADITSNKILYSICLENKITDNSINNNDNQLEDELDGIINYYNKEHRPDIYIIYLTPEKSDKSSNSFNKLDYDKKLHLFWHEDENAIDKLLSKILKRESIGEINPINEQSKYLIKSFISFIKMNFKSYLEEKQERTAMNKSHEGYSVIKKANFELNGKSYIVKRFSNNMIRIFDEEDVLQNIVVKDILREVIEIYHLSINEQYDEDRWKNTQVIGKEVIYALNNI